MTGPLIKHEIDSEKLKEWGKKIASFAFLLLILWAYQYTTYDGYTYDDDPDYRDEIDRYVIRPCIMEVVVANDMQGDMTQDEILSVYYDEFVDYYEPIANALAFLVEDKHWSEREKMYDEELFTCAVTSQLEHLFGDLFALTGENND